MKKVIIILILGLNLILLNSCAKPTVVNVTLPKDNELNCEKLEDALADAQEFRKKAMEVKTKYGLTDQETSERFCIGKDTMTHWHKYLEPKQTKARPPITLMY